MTTSVSVKVPKGACWDVEVTLMDFTAKGQLIRTTTDLLSSGERRDYYITELRSISRICELMHPRREPPAPSP